MKEEKDIQPIDKLFRQSLEGYSPVPPASVWQKIRLQLSEKKPGRGIWLFGPGGFTVISAVLLVLSGWVIYISFFADPDRARQNTSVSAAAADSEVMPKSVSPKNNIERDIQLNAFLKTVPTADKKSESPSPGCRKNPVSPQEPSTDNSARQTVTLSHSSVNAKTRASQKSPWKYDNPESFVPEKEDIPTIKNKQNAEIQLAEKEFVFNAPETIDAFIERSAGVVVTLDKDSKKEDDFAPITEKQGNKGNDINDIRDITEPSKPKSKDRFALAGMYGNLGQVYQKDRSPNLFYGGMITGGIWNNRWKAGIETGIGYSHYNDQGLYEFEFERSDTVGYTGYTYFNPLDSAYLIVYKPDIVDTLINFDTVTQTSYSYLKIPLYFSKQIFRSGKFCVGIKTGPSVEFMISRSESKPEYLPEGYTLVKITNKSYTRLTTSWQWLIAPQLSWDLTDKIRFTVEPAASFSLGNLYETVNKPSGKPCFLSIQAGIVYSFQK